MNKLVFKILSLSKRTETSSEGLNRDIMVVVMLSSVLNFSTNLIFKIQNSGIGIRYRYPVSVSVSVSGIRIRYPYPVSGIRFRYPFPVSVSGIRIRYPYPVPAFSTMPYLNSLMISYEKIGKINKFIKVMLCVSLICLNIIHKEN
jgi:hypothetical protein